MASRLLCRLSRTISGGGRSIGASHAWNGPIRRLAPAVGCRSLEIEGAPYLTTKSSQQASSANSTLQQFGFASMGANRHPTALDSRRAYSTGISNLPTISDPDIKTAFKELMAWDWDEIPNSVIHDVKKALSKDTEDKDAQEVLRNVFRAAEASVEFIAVLVNIRMALEERTGITGENVAELPEELVNAIKVAYNRYTTYVNSFGPEETFLRKKVEAELGTRLIHLKQRVSGLGSEWGEINVIGTSGLSGSYVEQRA